MSEATATSPATAPPAPTDTASPATAPPAPTDTEQKWKEAQAASTKGLKKTTFLGTFGKREQHDMDAFVMSKNVSNHRYDQCAIALL
jgi:hypothetical protein